jgi:GT2 family glycosyltransferase
MDREFEMELAVVILNWNATDDTIRCVRYISSWRNLQPTIWVIDNASTDDSVEVIVRECTNIRLIRNPVNLGFAGGTNQGITKSLTMGDGPILLLNNDAFIGENDVIRMLETLQENENFGFVGPLLFDAERKDRLLSAGSKNPVLHHQTRVLEFSPHHHLHPVECISGTVVLVRAEIFNTVGLLDENYFFSTELADLCTRAREQGHLCVIDTRARAYHALSRSAHFRDTLYNYYIIRNRFLYIRKFYHHLVKGLLYSFWGGYSLALTIKLILNGKQDTARAVYLGLMDGLMGRFGGQNERVLATCKRKLVPFLQPNQSEPRL